MKYIFRIVYENNRDYRVDAKPEDSSFDWEVLQRYFATVTDAQNFILRLVEEGLEDRVIFQSSPVYCGPIIH
jgi:hypothetical protein